MNIYSQKQRWKLGLFVMALTIVGISLWYTSRLVEKISKEEKRKVEAWADAVQQKGDLVKEAGILFKDLREQEKSKVQLWRDATEWTINSDLYNNTEISFVVKVIQQNTTVPVILVNEDGQITSFRNVERPPDVDSIEHLQAELESMKAQNEPFVVNYQTGKDYLYYKDSRVFSELKRVFEELNESFRAEVLANASSAPVIITDASRETVVAFGGDLDSSIVRDPALLKSTIQTMKDENDPIVVDLGDDIQNIIFYQDSFLLTQLKYFPVVQFGIIGLFTLIAYLLFSTARRVEQNQVWVGMSKETAHQLGTPLSSLMAWMEILKEKIDQGTAREMNKDIKRLETITERFSKIGSVPTLEDENIVDVLNHAVNYMKTRTSEKVKFKMNAPPTVMGKVNVPLFEWVIENLVRNAIDAMDGSGSITIDVQEKDQKIYIDVTDTGKGISKSNQKTIFQPGFTTKKRGWGLGLSLTKRIVKNYHKGRIFVKWSELNKGTTFRIILIG